MVTIISYQTGNFGNYIITFHETMLPAAVGWYRLGISGQIVPSLGLVLYTYHTVCSVHAGEPTEER